MVESSGLKIHAIYNITVSDGTQKLFWSDVAMLQALSNNISVLTRFSAHLEHCKHSKTSVVTVAGICNSVGGGVSLTCYHGAGGGGEYRSVGVKAIVVIQLETGGCRGFKIVLVVLECANCSLHSTLGGALSETVAPRLSVLFCR